MSKLSKELNDLIREFWADNWKRIYPPGAPRPDANRANFADFSNWLKEREASQRGAVAKGEDTPDQLHNTKGGDDEHRV